MTRKNKGRNILAGESHKLYNSNVQKKYFPGGAMGLITRISDANITAFEHDLQAMSDEKARYNAILASRASTILAHMERVSRRLECDLANIGTLRGGSYYVIDELVLCVREQPHIESGKAQVTEMREVLWQHFVYLVGLAPNGSLVYTKIGVLALLHFEGIMVAYNSSRSTTFDKELVQAALLLDS